MVSKKICPSCLQPHNRTTVLCSTCHSRRQRIYDARILTSPQEIKNLTAIRFGLGPFQQIHQFNEAVVYDLRNLHTLLIEPLEKIDNLYLKIMNMEDKLIYIENSLHFEQVKTILENIPSRYSIRLELTKYFDFKEDLFYLKRIVEQNFKDLDKIDIKTSNWDSSEICEPIIYSNPKDIKNSPLNNRAYIHIYPKISKSIDKTEVMIDYISEN